MSDEIYLNQGTLFEPITLTEFLDSQRKLTHDAWDYFESTNFYIHHDEPRLLYIQGKILLDSYSVASNEDMHRVFDLIHDGLDTEIRYAYLRQSDGYWKDNPPDFSILLEKASFVSLIKHGIKRTYNQHPMFGKACELYSLSALSKYFFYASKDPFSGCHAFLTRLIESKETESLFQIMQSLAKHHTQKALYYFEEFSESYTLACIQADIHPFDYSQLFASSKLRNLISEKGREAVVNGRYEPMKAQLKKLESIIDGLAEEGKMHTDIVALIRNSPENLEYRTSQKTAQKIPLSALRRFISDRLRQTNKRHLIVGENLSAKGGGLTPNTPTPLPSKKLIS